MVIKAFKAVHPSNDAVGAVPFGDIKHLTAEDIEEKIQQQQNSYLAVVSPTINTDATKQDRFKEVRGNFDEFLRKGYLEQETTSSVYLYSQEYPDGRTVTGLISLVSLDEENVANIKPHEEVLDSRVNMFTEYLENVELNSEPILFAFKNNNNFIRIVDIETRRTPLYSMTDDKEIVHSLWQISDRLLLKQTIECFSNVDKLVIADGHHRFESSLKLARKNPDNVTQQYALSFLVPQKELLISDYNRLVTLGDISPEDFLEKLSEKFRISEKGEEVYYPSQAGIFGMYLNKKFYSLRPRKKKINPDESLLHELDMYICDQFIVKELIAEKGEWNNSDEWYKKGKCNEESGSELKEKVDNTPNAVGFYFYPVLVQKIVDIASNDLYFPPKSTYIEPKLLSGLAIYDFSSEDVL